MVSVIFNRPVNCLSTLVSIVMLSYVTIIPTVASAEKICADLVGKTDLELQKLECPSGACDSSKCNCKTLEGCGAISKHVCKGDCSPPKGIVSGVEDGHQNHYTGALAPAIGGGVPTPKLADVAGGGANFSNTKDGNGKTKKPTLTTNPDLNQPQICTPASGVIPALPCGGGVPLLNSFTAVNPYTNVGTLLNIGSNVFVATPSPTIPSDTVNVIENKYATGTCIPSNFQLAGNLISLVLPGTTAATPIYSSTIAYQSNLGVLSLGALDTVEFDLKKPGFINLPNGGEFKLPSGDLYSVPPTTSLFSYGDGRLILPMVGPVPPVNGNKTPPANPQFYQQSLTIPDNWADTLVAMANKKTLPDYTVRKDPDYLPGSPPSNSAAANPKNKPTNYDTSLAVLPTGDNYPQLVGYYLDYTSATTPLVVYTNALTTYKMDLPSATTTVINLNTTIDTSNVSTPEGAILSIPFGTPVTFMVNQAGTLNLPAGGTIDVPIGSNVNGQVTTAPSQINVPQGNILNSDGAGTITLTSGVSITFPTGTVSANILTTAIQLPAGSNLPVNPGKPIITPQTPDCKSLNICPATAICS